MTGLKGENSMGVKLGNGGRGNVEMREWGNVEMGKCGNERIS